MSLLKERLLTGAIVAGMILAAPVLAYAQTAGGDAGTILGAAVTYLLGPFGIALASIGMVIIAILLFVGQHRYESMLLAVVAIALYFGGPGLIARIAGGG
jgi:type IV secretory pathway VirB2 component (pilin)